MSFVLFFTSMPYLGVIPEVKATEPTPWDGSIDTSWYVGKISPFNISTPAQLAGLAAIVNGTAKDKDIISDTFKGKSINLTADIDLNSKSWIPIGTWSDTTKQKPFEGIFNGSKHDISNICVVSSYNYQGLFGYVSSANISNLNIIKGDVLAGGQVGAVAGSINSSTTVINCTTNCSVTGTDNNINNTGGIIGRAENSTIKNCINLGEISGKSYVGGIAGTISENCEISDCMNAGKISGTSNVGGIGGFVSGANTIQKSINVGEIIATATSEVHKGGIIGQIDETENIIKNNYYDKQMCTCANAIGSDTSSNTGKLTNDMVGTSLKTALGDGWTYNDKKYPIPTEVKDLDVAIVAATPAFLYNNSAETANDYNTIVGVNKAFTVSKKNSVEWSNNNEVLTISGSLVTLSATKETEAKLTVTKGTASKSITLNVTDIDDRGSDSSPLEIPDFEELSKFRNAVNNESVGICKGFVNADGFSGIHFKVTAKNNIDLGGSEKPWTPIGTDTNQFKGNFDGGSKDISNIYIDSSDKYQGLFGYVDAGSISNVIISSGSVKSSSSSGGIVGFISKGTISNCMNSGSITSSNYSGGISGYVNVGTVKRCINTGEVTSNTAGATGKGGIIGYIDGICTIGNNYYDKQMCTCEKGVGLGIGSAEGKLTTEMVGDGLKTTLKEIKLDDGSVWTFDKGLYPIPKIINGVLYEKNTSDVGIVVATPVFLKNEEKANSVKNSFTVGTDNKVSWSSDNTNRINIESRDATIKSGNGYCKLTVSLNKAKKEIVVNVNKDGNAKPGSELNPQTICDISDLSDFRDAVNKGNSGTYKKIGNVNGFSDVHFKLTGNVVLSDPWTSIGTEKNVFKGNYDGDGYTIAGLDNSLFGYVSGSDSKSSQISNVVLANVNMESGSGGLINTLGSNTTIENCTVIGVVGTGMIVGGTAKDITYTNNAYMTTGKAKGIGSLEKDPDGVAAIDYAYWIREISGNSIFTDCVLKEGKSIVYKRIKENPNDNVADDLVEDSYIDFSNLLLKRPEIGTDEYHIIFLDDGSKIVKTFESEAGNAPEGPKIFSGGTFLKWHPLYGSKEDIEQGKGLDAGNAIYKVICSYEGKEFTITAGKGITLNPEGSEYGYGAQIIATAQSKDENKKISYAEKESTISAIVKSPFKFLALANAELSLAGDTDKLTPMWMQIPVGYTEDGSKTISITFTLNKYLNDISATEYGMEISTDENFGTSTKIKGKTLKDSYGSMEVNLTVPSSSEKTYYARGYYVSEGKTERSNSVSYKNS